MKCKKKKEKETKGVGGKSQKSGMEQRAAARVLVQRPPYAVADQNAVPVVRNPLFLIVPDNGKQDFFDNPSLGIFSLFSLFLSLLQL
jgi:hypothetical protein